MRTIIASFALFTLCASAQAQDRLEKCRAISADKDRLACFDDAARPMNDSSADKGAWHVEKTQSKLDRSPGVVASLKAKTTTKSRVAYSVTAFLVIRCAEQKTGAYVIFQDFRGDRETAAYGSADVEYRVGSNPVKKATWAASEDNGAYGPFDNKPSIEFAKALIGAQDLFIRAHSKIAGSTEVEFDLTGAQSAISEVRTICKW